MAIATPANAQATRTWVSGVGDDVNPCSRTAPCKTFAGAISKTAAGGEINCLDPGGFGAVTITKSLTISCPYTEGGVLAGGNGITVNDSASATPNTAVVFLRGLDIFGVNPPANGVRFISGAALFIEDSTIRRFNAANSFGISFQPAASARIYLNNVTIADNGNAATGGGIRIQPTGTGAARGVFRNVRVHNNANNGLIVDTVGNTPSATTGINLAIEHSSFTGNVNGIVLNGPTGTPNATVMLNHTVIHNNSSNGISATGPLARARVGNSTITGNGTGVFVTVSAVVNTYGTNKLDGNTADGAFTAPVLPQE